MVDDCSRLGRPSPCLLGAGGVSPGRLHRAGLLLVMGATFVAYLEFRQRFVGACDWFGYFELGRLLRTGTVFLDTPLPIEQYPSQVPLGFVASGPRAVPQYPPGFPLLLAVAGVLGAELLVPAVVGLLSCVLVYGIALDLTDRWAALGVAAIWALVPTVVFGATSIMSDLPAAAAVLGSYWAYRRGYVPVSALLFGLSVCIRPTNVLFGLALSILLLRDRTLLRFAAWTLPVVALYGSYNHLVYGALWRTGYGDLTGDLTAHVFTQHLGFYLRETGAQLAPLVLLAMLGLRRERRSELAFLLCWSSAYLFFYSFWRSGGDVWWWTRFLLPGYGPISFLAAHGLASVRERAMSRRTAARAWVLAGAACFLLLAVAHELALGVRHGDLWLRNRGSDYPHVVAVVEDLAPPGSFVGSVEFAGAFRIYGRSAPFVSTHSNAPDLVDAVAAQGHAAFLVVEPWNRGDPAVARLLARPAAQLVKELPLWGGVRIYRLTSAVESTGARPTPAGRGQAPDCKSVIRIRRDRLLPELRGRRHGL